MAREPRRRTDVLGQPGRPLRRRQDVDLRGGLVAVPVVVEPPADRAGAELLLERRGPDAGVAQVATVEQEVARRDRLVRGRHPVEGSRVGLAAAPPLELLAGVHDLLGHPQVQPVVLDALQHCGHRHAQVQPARVLHDALAGGVDGDVHVRAAQQHGDVTRVLLGLLLTPDEVQLRASGRVEPLAATGTRIETDLAVRGGRQGHPDQVAVVLAAGPVPEVRPEEAVRVLPVGVRRPHRRRVPRQVVPRDGGDGRLGDGYLALAASGPVGELALLGAAGRHDEQEGHGQQGPAHGASSPPRGGLSRSG